MVANVADKYRKTGMVARVPSVARYKDRQTGIVARVANVAW